MGGQDPPQPTPSTTPHDPEHHNYSQTISLLLYLSPYLWAIALTFYGFGDLLTTLIGLNYNGIVEVGPIAALFSHHGLPALLSLKLLSLLICALLWKLTPSPYRIGVPLGLAGLGVALTTWNLTVLFVFLPNA